MDGSWTRVPRTIPSPIHGADEPPATSLPLTGKHPPEGGDDGLRRPHSGHHRGKGPLIVCGGKLAAGTSGLIAVGRKRSEGAHDRESRGWQEGRAEF